MHALLVKTSSLGDVVHNLPVVTDIQRHLPGAVIDWVVEENFADIPLLHPGIRRVIPVAWRRWRKQLLSTETWNDIADFRRELKSDFYDAVLDTQGLIKSAIIARQAELAVDGRRLGYSAEAAREPMAARFYDVGFAIPKSAHAIERNRWLASAAFGYALDQALDYGIGAASLIADWLPTVPYAVFFTGTSRADKLWAESHWIELAQSLDVAVVLPAGNADERARAERLAAHLPQATVAPALSVHELACLSSGAKLVVGLDTGLTHLGAALNKPTLAIFSGSDPELTGVIAGSGGARAINIGDKGAPPAAADAIAAAKKLMQAGL